MKKYPLFIFLFSVYPSLALLSWNFREVDATVIIRPLLFSILVASFVCGLSLLLIKNRPKAILIATVFLIFFFSFGHVSIFVEGSNLGVENWLTNIFLSFAALLILFFLCRAILKTKKDLSLVYQTLNVISIFLVLSSGLMLLNNYVAKQAGSPNQRNEVTEKVVGPDVYYIILDAYGGMIHCSYWGTTIPLLSTNWKT